MRLGNFRDTFNNFRDIGIQRFQIFGDICQFLFRDMEYFSKYLKGYGILGTPFRGLNRINLSSYLGHIIQLLPLCEGNMTICSPEAGNIARGRGPGAILPVKGEQIVMLSSHNCLLCRLIFCLQCEEKKRTLVNAVSLFNVQSNYCEYKYNGRFQQ